MNDTPISYVRVAYGAFFVSAFIIAHCAKIARMEIEDELLKMDCYEK